MDYCISGTRGPGYEKTDHLKLVEQSLKIIILAVLYIIKLYLGRDSTNFKIFERLVETNDFFLVYSTVTNDLYSPLTLLLTFCKL